MKEISPKELQKINNNSFKKTQKSFAAVYARLRQMVIIKQLTNPLIITVVNVSQTG